MAVSKRKGKDAPPERQRRQRLVDKWHRQLLKNPTALRQFKEYRLLTTNTIKQFRIGYTKNGFPEEGWDGPVYTLPISDEQGDPITVKLFHWDHEPKMRWLRAKRPGEDSNELFL